MDIQQRILERLLQAQETGGLTGIIGRLGDLGTIDKRFDIAISTSCPGLNMIVVETVDDAGKVLKYLRDQRIGQAKCLALDQVTQKTTQYMEKPFNPPENSKRLFDLIKANREEYRVAFFSAINNTLVVNDIETANDIAYGAQRHRVVTLNGELFELSGVISGGGKPKKGLMSSQHRSKSKSNNFQSTESLIAKKDKLVQKVSEIEHTINGLQAEINQLYQSDASREAKVIKERYPANKKAITHRMLKYEEELKAAVQKYEKCLDQKKEKEEHLNRLIANIDKAARKELELINEKISELKTEIESAGGAAYVDIKSKYEDIKVEYDTQFELIGKAKSMKQIGENEVSKLVAEIVKIEGEVESYDIKTEELKKKVKQIEDE